MEVRISKREGGKIKIENDEMIVRVNSKDSVKHVPTNLKSKFEESVALIRALEKPPKHTATSKTILPQPVTPNFSTHPLLQTLLNIVWQCHVARYRIITSTFKNAIGQKVLITRRLRDFDAMLCKTESEMLENVTREGARFLEEKERDELANIKEALRRDGSIDELIEFAIERGIASTGEERIFFAPRIDANLRAVSEFQFETNKLWNEWKLQVDRQRLVFQGKLESLDKIDADISKVRASCQEVQKEEDGDEDGIPMFSKLYRAMVEQLSALKMRREMHDQAFKRYRVFMHEKFKTAKMKVYAKIRADTVKDEHVAIEEATMNLKKELDSIKLTQDRATIEINTAGSSARLEPLLKSMSATIDLNLESAREYLYNEGLDALLAWQ